jgi:hypothetical protein
MNLDFSQNFLHMDLTSSCLSAPFTTGISFSQPPIGAASQPLKPDVY